MSSPPTPPTASSITVKETLELLNNAFASMAEGVAAGQYVFWLGSGISRGRVPDLRGVAETVLEFLRLRINPTDPGCAHAKALREAVDLAGLREDEQARIDFGEPVASWDLRDLIVNRLVARYSELLDIRIPGQPEDYLLWEAVDVRAEFPAGAPPDCEHLCLAILSLEGVVPDAASTNWDGLIESAVAELSGAPDQVLRVIVLAEDFRKPLRRTDLLKFHGCALLAASDPARYRDALVAAKSRITSWPNAARTAVMRDTLQTLATTRPTLMIGLSAQDSNIQDLFAKAREQMDWDWPSNPPAHVFAGDDLGTHHRQLLKIVYRDHYEEHGEDIERSALLRAYAQQLLTALVLYVLAAKLRAFIDTIDAPGLAETDRNSLRDGLGALLDRVPEHADPDRLAFVRALVREEARAMSFFQEGGDPPGYAHYRPISGEPADQIAANAALTTSGVRELAAALGLLGRGSAGGVWEVSTGPTPAGGHGALKAVATSGAETAVFFAANGKAAVYLEVNGHVDATADDVVMIHSTEPVGVLSRSPRGHFGRTGHGGVRHVDMGELLKASTGLSELESRFRHAAAL